MHAQRPCRPGRRQVAAHRLGWFAPLSLALLAPATQAAVFVPGAAAADPPTGDVVSVAPRRAAEPLRAPGFQWVLAPWRHAGTVSLDGRWMRLDDGRTSRQGLVLTDLEWSSYLWQPWFMQMRFGLGLLAVRDVSGGNAETSSGTSSGTTGRMSLALFPASRFPFELRADLGDSRTSGDALGSTVRSQRLSLSQSYRPEVGNRSVHLQLDHSRLTAAEGTDRLTSLQLGGQQQVGEHNVDMSGSFSHNQRSDSGDSSRLASISAHHGFHPRPELQVETMASWNQTRLRGSATLQQDLGSDVRQLTTVVNWRPREGDPLYSEHLPLQVAGSARWVEVRATGTDPRQRAQAYAATLGANLELSADWRLSGGLSANRLQTSAGTVSDATGFNGTVGWTPNGTQLAGWRYTPSASTNFGLTQTSGAERRQVLGLQGSHGLSRDWVVGEGQQLALNVSQSAAVLKESLTPTLALALAHSLGVFWQAAGEGGQQRFASLSLSDSRSRAASDGQFQLVNLQLSQRTQVSRQTGWSVNLTLQATRNESTEIDAFTGDRRLQASGWQHFYSGGASLEQQRLFGIPRLRHTLQFSVNSQQIERRSAGDIDAPRERITQSLESRVDYAVGRLDLRLSARHAMVDGRAVATVNARLQRRF